MSQPSRCDRVLIQQYEEEMQRRREAKAAAEQRKQEEATTERKIRLAKGVSCNQAIREQIERSQAAKKRQQELEAETKEKLLGKKTFE